MWWTNIIIVSLFLQTLLITRIDGNTNRRRRRQAAASYGANSNLGANSASGYNYPANANYYGTNLNNPGTKDLYGNSNIPSNTGNSLNSMGLNNQQQQQLYGTNGQSLSNPSLTGSNFYSGSGTNQLLRDGNGNMMMRDSNGNPLPAGSVGSSLYSSSNTQMGYPSNTNQHLTNKDLYGNNLPSNTNNNQYGYNSNLLPNSNTYGGQMSNNNNNLYPNNNNNNHQYNANTGSAWYPNRDLNNNNNNNNNAYSNPNPNSPYLYNNAREITTSCLIIFLSFIANFIFHI